MYVLGAVLSVRYWHFPWTGLTVLCGFSSSVNLYDCQHINRVGKSSVKPWYYVHLKLMTDSDKIFIAAVTMSAYSPSILSLLKAQLLLWHPMFLCACVKHSNI